MKRILLVAISMALAALFAADDPEYAYVDVPYACSVDKEQKAVTVTFSDGSIRNFYYCSFTDQHKKVTDAMEQFGAAYNSIVNIMSDGGITEKFYSENMARWEQVVQSILYIGQVKQQEIEYVLQSEFVENYKNGLITEAEYTSRMTASESKLAELKNNYETLFSEIYQSMAQSIASLEQQKEALEETQALQMQTLQNLIQNSGSSTAINEAVAAAQKSAIDIAALKKSISALKTETAKRQQPIIAIGDMSRGMFTSNILDVTRWMGSRSKAFDVFVPPVNPVTSNRYNLASGDNIVTWMRDFGIVGYLSTELYFAHRDGTGDSANIDKFYGYANVFYEDVETNSSETVTNVCSTFKAPKNWADGSTVICTNGVFTAIGGTAIRFKTDGLYGSSGEAVVGSGVRTNVVEFQSDANAAMKFTIRDESGTVYIKMGAFYR